MAIFQIMKGREVLILTCSLVAELRMTQINTSCRNTNHV